MLFIRSELNNNIKPFRKISNVTKNIVLYKWLAMCLHTRHISQPNYFHILKPKHTSASIMSRDRENMCIATTIVAKVISSFIKIRF